MERLYKNYIRYQSGDKIALDEVFMEVGKNVSETNRIVELEEEYKLSHVDNVLDAGLVQDEIHYRRNDRKLKVVFSCVTRRIPSPNSISPSLFAIKVSLQFIIVSIIALIT